MSGQDEMFGWDLTFRVAEKSITKKADVLVVFIHWNLTKFGFKCLGVGDEKELKSDDVGSELLPDNWNVDEKCAMRYVFKGEVFVFHKIISAGNAIFNLLRSSNLNVSNIAIDIEKTVESLSGPIETVMPTYKDVMKDIKSNLIEVVTERISNRNTAGTQTQVSVETQRGSRPGPTYRQDVGIASVPDPGSILRVGQADLNPFGMGGGMLFDPFNNRPRPDPGFGIPGGLPRGAVPPGARFDPVGPMGPMGPMGPRRQFPPDFDDFPPPGNDHMFM